MLSSTGILDDEDDPETLINVNMVDAERALRNVENKKKKPDYNPYDDAEEDEYGMVGNTWVKVFSIIPEFRILRLTFHRKSASKC